MRRRRIVTGLGGLIAVATVAATSQAGPPCTVADNGSGTINLPPQNCDYVSPDDLHQMLDGLPPGTTIEMDASHRYFFCGQSDAGCANPPPTGRCEFPGGSLGGSIDCFGSMLFLTLTGSGSLQGYQQSLTLFVTCEVHTAPRTPGQPVQDFDTRMFRLSGQQTVVSDFDYLRITGGTDFGMPSPGHTTLTRQPGGEFTVDSFFDVGYEIEYRGAAGGPLAGYAGVSRGRVRMETGDPPTPPDCNSNGVPDYRDIIAGVSLDVDGSGVPDECEVVCIPPSITAAPESMTVCQGQSVLLRVTPGGSGPMAYLWRKNGVGIAGATADALAIASATQADVGAYDVEVRNACGSIVSDAATLMVWPRATADLNGDAAADGLDIALFIRVLLTTPNGPADLPFCAGDMDRSGVVDVADIRLFVLSLLAA